MSRAPLVSVVVPSYNQGRFIRATLDSILAQDYRPIEILVIDGASTDETLDVLRSYEAVPELTWISEPDSGVVEAVNKGFARVQGDIVAIQSSDDRYLDGTIGRIVETFREHVECGLVYGDTVKVDAMGHELSRYRIGPWSLENLFLLKTWIPQPSCFFRRELLEACGGWDGRIPYAPDTDLWIRMAFRTKVMKVDEYMSQRRIHGDQRDTQSERILQDYRRLIAQSRDIAEQPASVRNAARAGSHLLYRRYNPSGSELRALWHDFKAALIDRRAFNARRWRSNAVVIPLRKLLQPLAPAKRWLGCWLNERWRTEVALSPFARFAGIEWRDLCNRHERVEKGDDPVARHVETEHTSYLTVAQKFPRVGGRLAERCFAEHPFSDLASSDVDIGSNQRLTVVIPVGGNERTRAFRFVLRALINQSMADVEYLVLEHSAEPLYEKEIPPGIKYCHLQMQDSEEEFNKARLLNLGVSKANAPAVLLHDADILVPEDYLEQAYQKMKLGFDAIRPLRLLFYLESVDTQSLIRNHCLPRKLKVDSVAQNSQGGSTMIKVPTYWEIGGHDESFRGWGGEDLEFLQRLRTRRLFRGGLMPAIHLWHPPASKKASGDRNWETLRYVGRHTPEERIEKLVKQRNYLAMK